MRRIAPYLLLLIVLGSCVSNQKYQLLQKNDVNKYNLAKDSVVRSYNVDDYIYRVQTNDLLNIKLESLTPRDFDVFSRPEQSQSSNLLASGIGALVSGELVDSKGEIPFPIVGKVHVANMTVDEIQDQLQEIASKYLQNPIVKVRLLNYRVNFLGEVKKEGSIGLVNNRVSVLEALSLAGGFTDLADRSDVKLIRQNGSKTEVIYLNFLDEQIMKSPYFYVHQNDVFIVPALKQRPFRNYFTSNLSLALSAISILLILYTTTKK